MLICNTFSYAMGRRKPAADVPYDLYDVGFDGRRLSAIRLRRPGLSQDAIAEAIGVNPTTVSRWENTISIPSGDELLKLSLFLSIDPYDLFMLHPAARHQANTRGALGRLLRTAGLPAEAELIELLGHMPDAEKQRLLGAAQVLAETSGMKRPPPPEPAIELPRRRRGRKTNAEKEAEQATPAAAPARRKTR